jgi:hypothetical protein
MLDLSSTDIVFGAIVDTSAPLSTVIVSVVVAPSVVTVCKSGVPPPPIAADEVYVNVPDEVLYVITCPEPGDSVVLIANEPEIVISYAVVPSNALIMLLTSAALIVLPFIIFALGIFPIFLL